MNLRASRRIICHCVDGDVTTLTAPVLETEDSRRETSTIDKDELDIPTQSPENDVQSFDEELEASLPPSVKETSRLPQCTKKIASGAYFHLSKTVHVRTWDPADPPFFTRIFGATASSHNIFGRLRCSDVIDAIILIRHPSARNSKIHNMITIRTSRTRHDTRLKENVSSINKSFFQNRDIRQFSDLFYYSSPALSFWPLTFVYSSFLFRRFFFPFDLPSFIFSMSDLRNIVWFPQVFLRYTDHFVFVSFVWRLQVCLSLCFFFVSYFDGFSYNFVVSSSRVNWLNVVHVFT